MKGFTKTVPWNNKYHKKDIKILMQMFRDRYFEGNHLVNLSGSLQTVINIVEIYEYKIPRYNMAYLNTQANDFIYRTPFVDVPKYVNHPTLKMLAEWRLKIGR